MYLTEKLLFMCCLYYAASKSSLYYKARFLKIYVKYKIHLKICTWSEDQTLLVLKERFSDVDLFSYMSTFTNASKPFQFGY